MSLRKPWAWLLILVFTALLYFYVSGLALVPFHPDESTYLYQSQDFELYLSQPLSLAWTPDSAADPLLRYRALDAPLVRYIIGLGRTLAGFSSEEVRVDWDWSKPWEENQAAGALPARKLLLAGRLATTIPLFAGLLFIYSAGEKLGGIYAGLAGVIFLGLSALSLLHGRRAMAEGPMLFGIAFAIWALLQAGERPWLAGLGAALAVSAKYSVAAILPVGLLGAIWLAGAPHGWRKSAGNGAKYLAAFGMLFFLLHPLLWRHPLGALRKMLEARQELLQRQVSLTEQFLPEQVLHTPTRRAAVLLANLYFAPLSFQEVGNYVDQTTDSVSTYLENPLHNLLRNPVGGAALLGLTLTGIGLTSLRARKQVVAVKKNLALLAAATLLQFALLIAAVPLPIQRYALPLLPYLCLWMGLAFASPLPPNETPAG